MPFFHGKCHGKNQHVQRPAGTACAIHARRHGHFEALRELLDALGEQPAERDPEKPHWDKQARELRFRSVVVRTVPKPASAGNTVQILDEFEDIGWPPRIEDPFGEGGKDDRRRRAVETLNNGILKKPMWFECDGDGTGFIWRTSPRGTARKTAKNAAKRKSR